MALIIRSRIAVVMLLIPTPDIGLYHTPDCHLQLKESGHEPFASMGWLAGLSLKKSWAESLMVERLWRRRVASLDCLNRDWGLDGMSELLQMAALELGRRIRTGELSPVQVVDEHIARIEAVNPRLNALVTHRFEGARQEAIDAQERIARLKKKTALSPLFGVPCTIKEFLAHTELFQSGGLKSREGFTPSNDATVVARLKAAGAIILGGTNIPEGGLWMETHNLIYGRTNNPWNPSYSPGGSSGGEGALLAAGASPFGLGSDVGGSVRIPSAFCGLVGHKPSGRLVPNTGHFPAADPGVSPYLVIGPMGRTVDDVEAVLSVIAGPDGIDDACTPMPWQTTAKDGLAGLRVMPQMGNGRTRIWKSMRAAVDESTAALQSRGAQVEARVFPRLRKGLEIWSSMLSDAADAHYDRVLGDGAPINIWRQLLALPFGRADHAYHALILAAADALSHGLSGMIEKYVSEGRALQRELEDALGRDGVLICPPYSRTAPRHHFSWLTPFDAVCTAIFNVMEFPATVVPVGMSDDGLPVCVQIVGARGCDGLTLAVARALEADFGGWRMAPVLP